MRVSPARFAILGMIAIAFLVPAAFYPMLPDPMPTHWNAAGEVNGHMAKPLGAFLLPLVMAGTFALLLALPRLSPRGFEMTKFASAYETIGLGVEGFLFLLSFATLASALGRHVPMNQIVPALLGLLFLVLGNVMSKLTPNFFAGVRTPWTLADPEVWLRTHRFAGRLFVLAGFVLILAAAVGVGGGYVAAIALAAALTPAVYSYVLYRRLERMRE